MQYDEITEQSIASTKGAEFKLGDLVQAKGSKVTRRIVGIHRGEVRGVRTTPGAASSMWLAVDGIKLV